MSPYQAFFTGRPTEEIASDLLGRELSCRTPAGLVAGLIVETEAYLGEGDSASHAYNGRRTAYSESLYGAPGTIYVYQIRAHYCFDVAVQDQGEPQGVLIRALEPTVGVELMEQRRHQKGVNLTNGPGKLGQALGIIDRHLDGRPLENAPLTIDLTKKRVPKEVTVTPRVGVNQKGSHAQAPLRFFVAHNPYVSKMLKREADLRSHGWEGEEWR